MGRIKQLVSEEAQKIAAGEVVERPVNILKELLENALDAGAASISIYVQQAGKKLLRVVDDGCGMELADILACVLPHATSKISRVEDLAALATYGFRGEALASIAAVTKLEIVSREARAPVAWRCEFAGGTCSRQEQVAANPGTEVRVADLFHNIPVRKKFLKQDETEWTAIRHLVEAMALSHRSIKFSLYREDKLVLNAPPATDLASRVAQVWGYQMAEQCVPLGSQEAREKPNLRVEGIISLPQYWRYNKQQIIFFVNGRWVRDGELVRHFLKGYHDVLPIGKFPAGCVFVTVDPQFVDVNVHPKKEEVRFAHPHKIYQAVLASVEQALRSNIQQQVFLSSSLSRDEKVRPVEAPRAPQVFPVQERWYGSAGITGQDPMLPKSVARVPVFRALGDAVMAPHAEPGVQEGFPTLPLQPLSLPEIESAAGGPRGEELVTFEGAVILGQLFQTYILIDRGSELVFVDQHAAHERVLYERMARSMAEREGTLLLFPQILSLGRELLEVFVREQGIFAEFGFEIDQHSTDAVAIKAIPTGVQSADIQDAILLSLALAQQNERLEAEALRKLLHEHMHSHLACKRAVRAGDTLTREQMEQLLKDLAACAKPFICVHGRPTLWKLSRQHLEKNFQRR